MVHQIKLKRIVIEEQIITLPGEWDKYNSPASAYDKADERETEGKDFWKAVAVNDDGWELVTARLGISDAD